MKHVSLEETAPEQPTAKPPYEKPARVRLTIRYFPSECPKCKRVWMPQFYGPKVGELCRLCGVKVVRSRDS